MPFDDDIYSGEDWPDEPGEDWPEPGEPRLQESEPVGADIDDVGLFETTPPAIKTPSQRLAEAAARLWEREDLYP